MLTAASSNIGFSCPYCDINTAGEHQPGCPNYLGPPGLVTYTPPSPGRRGWICPRCGRSLAPWVRECDAGLYIENLDEFTRAMSAGT